MTPPYGLVQMKKSILFDFDFVHNLIYIDRQTHKITKINVQKKEEIMLVDLMYHNTYYSERFIFA